MARHLWEQLMQLFLRLLDFKGVVVVELKKVLFNRAQGRRVKFCLREGRVFQSRGCRTDSILIIVSSLQNIVLVMTSSRSFECIKSGIHLIILSLVVLVLTLVEESDG